MDSTLIELGAELATVKAAITAAYSGSEYEIQSGGSAGGSRRRLKRQNLDVLLNRRSELETQIARLCGVGGTGVRHGLIEG